jgi:RimJ/RimL family protein N-acetyltransferase
MAERATTRRTDRLELRPVEDADIDRILQYRNSPEVTHWLIRTEAELGYIFDPAYAGHGYASEAVAAVVAMAFEELGVRRLTAGCFADNLASARILEKVGMRREQHGVGDSWHADLGWVDGYTYGMLADEWTGT